MITFVQILDSDINQLTSMRGLAFENFQTQYYHSVLLNYLTGNDFELLNNQHELERLIKINPELFILLQVVKLRYLIRTYQVTEGTMKEFSNLSHIPSQWLGEYLFVLSSAASTLHAHKLSIEYSLQSFHELKRLGAKKKAVRALTNAIASESCIRPEKHYLSDLLYAYREAKAIQDFPTIANTLLNLSREYQRLSLFAMATKYANRALALYSKHNHGGLDHLLGLCHRAYLYAQIEAYKEAQQDIEAAMGSPFLEVKSAIAIMLEKFPKIKISYLSQQHGLIAK